MRERKNGECEWNKESGRKDSVIELDCEGMKRETIVRED